ncbi:MAG: hydroxyacid dehydrogenase [Gammaproteobacteria bacterium]|nr:MAG: hydroxyacid dehydrogenase [Gammaproteobacteria bacterium]
MTIDKAPFRALKKDLTSIVGEHHILFSNASSSRTDGDNDDNNSRGKILPYLRESRGRHLGQAFAVVFPNNTKEIVQIVATCHRYKTPIVPQGGNTGRCLGAQSRDAAAVIVNLKNMNRIREINVNNMTVTAEAGCILQDLQEAVAKTGHYFPLALGAEGSCQIGGNLATNAGGINVLRYGNTRDLTLGIEAVLPDGNVLNDLYGLRKNNTGYDLKQLLIGSEGTLGIITAATFKLFPPEINNEHGFIAVNHLDDAITCLKRAQAHFVGKVSTFEIIPNIAIRFMERHSDVRCPIDNTYPWYIWYKIADANPDTPLFDDNLNFLEKLMNDGLIVNATVSYNESMKQLFWKIREMIVAVQKHEEVSIKFDVSVPISAIPQLVERGNKAVADICPSITPYPFGHLGDGNLHYNFTRPKGVSPDDFVRHYQQTINDVIFDIVDSLHGSFSAEHGIGSQKLKQMNKYKDPAAIDIMRRIKQVFDPLNLMNPGKVIPPEPITH